MPRFAWRLSYHDSAPKCFIYRLFVIIDGRENRFRTRFPSSPSINNFNPVQSISRVRTARQSLMNFPNVELA